MKTKLDTTLISRMTCGLWSEDKAQTSQSHEREETKPVKEVKENESQALIKKSPETLTLFFRQGEYKNFKEAFNASGFAMFTSDIFGLGEDNYHGKESKMLDYLTAFYIKMYGDGEMEYQKQELEKNLKLIDRLRNYIPV